MSVGIHTSNGFVKVAGVGMGASPMTGATENNAGKAGLVPAPAIADRDKFLKGDGTWGEVNLEASIESTKAYIDEEIGKIPAWAKEENKPAYTADEIGADPKGSADTALSEAKSYVDEVIEGLEITGGGSDSSIFNGTIEEYNNQKDTIEDGTVVNITDDLMDGELLDVNALNRIADVEDTVAEFDEAKVNKTDILSTMEEVTANTNTEALASANVVKELSNSLGGLQFGVDENGNYGYIKAGADSVTPFSNGIGRRYLIGEVITTGKTEATMSLVDDMSNYSWLIFIYNGSVSDAGTMDFVNDDFLIPTASNFVDAIVAIVPTNYFQSQGSINPRIYDHNVTIKYVSNYEITFQRNITSTTSKREIDVYGIK